MFDPGYDNYIYKNIKRCNKNLLVINGFLVIMVLIIGFAANKYLYNFFFGPFDIDNKTLTLIKDPDLPEKYFCNVTGDAVYESGVQYIIQNIDKYSNKVTSEKVEAYYYILEVNKKLLIVKTPESEKKHSYSGAIIKTPGDVENEIIGKMKDKESKKAFLPFMLDATSFRTDGYWGLGICLPILFLAMWNLFKFFQRNSVPEEHPLYKKLGNYGVASDIASKIHNEVMSVDTVRIGNATITSSWLLVESYFKLDLENLSDIMWIYKKITTHKSYGVTTAKTFSAYIMLRNGKAITIGGKEIQVNDIINLVCKKAPWVIAGFSNEIKNLWDKQRQTFIDTVDQKRSELMKNKSDFSENQTQGG